MTDHQALLSGIQQLAEVAVDDLQAQLGFAERLSFPAAWQNRPVSKWTMESDDVILRYIFRNLRPKRHLEFGTWEGDGVIRCVEECEATVWTINLLEGETLADGQWAYGSQTSDLSHRNVPSQELTIGTSTWVRTDAYGMIGHKYLEQGFGNRVCQIYSDSQAWDTRQYPHAFFDSVFVDGGHSRPVVAADSRAAIQLVRSGGLVMWHDFCPWPEALALSEPARGVGSAIAELREDLAAEFRQLFWIRPSWLLVGVRR